MNKKYLSVVLFGALLAASAGTFTSCKDYDDDIKGLQEQIDKSGSTITDLQTQLTTLKAAAEAAQATADAAKAAAVEAKTAADAAKAAGDQAKLMLLMPWLKRKLPKLLLLQQKLKLSQRLQN